MRLPQRLSVASRIRRCYFKRRHSAFDLGLKEAVLRNKLTRNIVVGWRPTTIMPPHRCCTSCSRESASPGGISLHRQHCRKYKDHMSTVWKLKNRATTAQASLRGKFNAGKGLGQTPPGSQQREPECRMEIDSDDMVVSIIAFTGSTECSDYRLNSRLHLPVVLSLAQCLCLLHRMFLALFLKWCPYLRVLHRHLHHVLYQLCCRHLFPYRLLLHIAYPRCHCYYHLQLYRNQVVCSGSIVCLHGIRTSILNRRIPYPRHQLPILLHPCPLPLRPLSSHASSGLLYGIPSKQT
jgi:hypothetical protein